MLLYRDTLGIQCACEGCSFMLRTTQKDPHEQAKEALI